LNVFKRGEGHWSGVGQEEEFTVTFAHTDTVGSELDAILVFPAVVFSIKNKIDSGFVPQNGLWYKYFS